MNYRQSRYQLFSVLAAVIIIFAGCAPQIEELTGICPGKRTAEESLSLLRSRSEYATPLKASGQCLLKYYTKDGKLKKENFPVKLWVNPPAEIFIQGNVAFDPKAITIGSNEHEFWLAMKPKEISSYWWGQWSEENRPEKLMVNPKLVLEALGIVTAENINDWYLSKEVTYDMLTNRQGGTKTKKIYINRCNYLVRRIEYFDDDSEVTIAAELKKYRELLSGFFVPAFIKIIHYSGGNERDSVQITLGSMKQTSFTDKQINYLFARPRPEGFKHIYKIVGGNTFEQPQ